MLFPSFARPDSCISPTLMDVTLSVEASGGPSLRRGIVRTQGKSSGMMGQAVRGGSTWVLNLLPEPVTVSASASASA